MVMFRDEYHRFTLSPQTSIATRDIYVPLNLTTTCTSTLGRFDTQCKCLLCFTEYIFRNIFAQGITQIRQIFFRQCIYTVNLPNFSAVKVSLHTVYKYLIIAII